MATTAKAKRAKISSDQLSAYYSHNETRKEFDRKGRTIKRALEAIETELRAALEAAGQVRATRGGYTVAIEAAGPLVKWKDEMIKAVGADAVAAIEAAADKRSRLTVSKD